MFLIVFKLNIIKIRLEIDKIIPHQVLACDVKINLDIQIDSFNRSIMYKQPKLKVIGNSSTFQEF